MFPEFLILLANPAFCWFWYDPRSITPLMMKDFPCHSVVRYIPYRDWPQIIWCAFFLIRFFKNNAISIGDSFDAEAIKISWPRLIPKWEFPSFGEQANWLINFSMWSSMEKHDLRIFFPYIQHADVGLALYCEAPQADYISHSSLRMIQYIIANFRLLHRIFGLWQGACLRVWNTGNAQDLCRFYLRKDYERESISKDTILDWQQSPKWCSMISCLGRCVLIARQDIPDLDGASKSLFCMNGLLNSLRHCFKCFFYNLLWCYAFRGRKNCNGQLI